MKRRIDMSTVLKGAPTSKETHDWCPPLDRRAALRLISMSAVAAMAGCGVRKARPPGRSPQPLLCQRPIPRLLRIAM